MPSLSLSSLLSSLFYLLPLYLFVLAPLLRSLFPASNSPPPSHPDFYTSPPLDPQIHASSPLDPSVLSLPDAQDALIAPTCPSQPYKPHLLARDPLIIYLEAFLSAPEADHLVDLSLHPPPSNSTSNSSYTPSIIFNGTAQTVDPSRRNSDRALLPRSDRTVRCLERRASAFQGWKPNLYIERMWAQRYNVSGHYRHHYDWVGSAARGGDRATTFMVYLGDECEGGGTNFPRVRRPVAEEWCRFVECNNDNNKDRQDNQGDGGDGVEGVTFKPIKGNAIYWENIRPDGSGYEETWHAAFPVTRGVKYGLNIWSWYQAPRRKGEDE